MAQKSEEPKQQCRFLKEESVASGKWLSLNKITYADPTGKERTWEAVRRTTKQSSDTADAVCSIPILKRLLHYDCVVLVKQYRPPMKSCTLEFPAGLLDVNETPETCAVRELKEETGYTGVVKHTSPGTSLDPGMGDTTVQLVSVEIDGDLPENQNPQLQADEGEFIEVVVVPMDELLKKVNEFSLSGVVVDSRVYMYAVCMEQMKKMKHASL